MRTHLPWVWWPISGLHPSWVISEGTDAPSRATGPWSMLCAATSSNQGHPQEPGSPPSQAQPALAPRHSVILCRYNIRTELTPQTLSFRHSKDKLRGFISLVIKGILMCIFKNRTKLTYYYNSQTTEGTGTATRVTQLDYTSKSMASVSPIILKRKIPGEVKARKFCLKIPACTG